MQNPRGSVDCDGLFDCEPGINRYLPIKRLIIADDLRILTFLRMASRRRQRKELDFISLNYERFQVILRNCRELGGAKFYSDLFFQDHDHGYVPKVAKEVIDLKMFDWVSVEKTHNIHDLW